MAKVASWSARRLVHTRWKGALRFDASKSASNSQSNPRAGHGSGCHQPRVSHPGLPWHLYGLPHQYPIAWGELVSQASPVFHRTRQNPWVELGDLFGRPGARPCGARAQANRPASCVTKSKRQRRSPSLS
eukprot:scaffold1473_cov375-Prasinococcus_capsulatus_cf.AAC.3